MAVIDELARGINRGDEFRAIDRHIEPPLQSADQIVGAVSPHADRLKLICPKLPFRNIAIVAFEFLLCLELCSEIGKLA